MPYIQKDWPVFSHAGQDYDLSHLNEYIFECLDSDQVARKILVTFEDHCFTRDTVAEDPTALHYPGCSRRPTGTFCVERWQLSLSIRQHIASAAGDKVWITHGAGFAIVPTVDHRGQPCLYAIAFDLIKVSGLPFQLRMLVKTAFPLDRVEHGKPQLIDTFGHTKFTRLVKLRMEGKSPARDTNRNRQVPKMK